MLSLEQYTVLIDEWQHHAAAIGVFLVWGELMLMIGRLPTFGIYVQVGVLRIKIVCNSEFSQNNLAQTRTKKMT